MIDPVSDAFFERALRVIPGGVNSPVRAFRAVGTTPIFASKGAGAHVYGANGARYVDYVGSWGPLILGHAHAAVVAAATEALARGTSYGMPTELEVRFAELLCGMYESLDMVRAVSSGTEATMSALRAARGFTGRDVVVKFEGCYHGHSDGLLVKAGSGGATFGVPDSAGVPASIAVHTLTLPFNDIDALHALFAARGPEIAAVIVEPVAGNMGVVPPAEGFLEAIVAECTRAGSVSVFDEVMTGCRVGRSGMQGCKRLSPDLTCLGKIVGGGFPLAAYGGRRAIMERLSPLGPVYQAGTLSGNPVAVSAGLATLERLDEALYARLDALSARLQVGFEHAIEKTKARACVQRVGSMLTLFFTEGPVRSWSDAKECDTGAFARWHQGLLSRGVYWPPAQFEAAFVSAAHSDKEIDETISAAEAALRGLTR
jgi:glutamate-1-semialdehyde 2,1-aminomutase